jgi:hypothetical protein
MMLAREGQRRATDRQSPTPGQSMSQQQGGTQRLMLHTHTPTPTSGGLFPTEIDMGDPRPKQPHLTTTR